MTWYWSINRERSLTGTVIIMWDHSGGVGLSKNVFVMLTQLILPSSPGASFLEVVGKWHCDKQGKDRGQIGRLSNKRQDYDPRTSQLCWNVSWIPRFGTLRVRLTPNFQIYRGWQGSSVVKWMPSICKAVGSSSALKNKEIPRASLGGE